MAKPKVPNHLKPQRGLGQEITRVRRRQRDMLRKGEEIEAMQRRNAAMEEIMRIRNQRKNDESRWYNSLVASVVDNQIAFMRSLGLRQSVDYRVEMYTTSQIQAYTDFSTVVIRYPSNKIPAKGAASSEVLECISDIRGIMQHEIGHLRFTVPFVELLPLIKDTIYGQYRYKLVWNILEDQRMETKVVNAVPRIASYFTHMVYRHILVPPNGMPGSLDRAWLLVAGRKYLPRDVRQQCRVLFDQLVPSADPDNPSSLQWATFVKRYKTATTLEDLAKIVTEATHWYYQHMTMHGDPQGGTEHNDPQPPTPWDDQSRRSQGDPSDACDDEQDDDIDYGSDHSDDEQDDDSSGTGDSEDDEPSENGSAAGGGTPDSDRGEQSSDGSDKDASGTDAGTSGRDLNEQRQDLRKQMNDAINDIRHEQQSDKDNQSMLRNANEMANGEGLPSVNGSGSPLPLELVDKALRYAVGIEQALTEFVTVSQPAWLSHQESGIIDPLSYRTRQVGALDYHRRLDGDFTSGLDVHVSMLCDVSGSMGGTPIKELSTAMYAIKTACDRLGIGSTHVLWSGWGSAGRVWDHGPADPQLWTAHGGTHPVPALDDLDHHNPEGARKHLVMVLTDGAWGNVPPLTRWANEDRHIILIGLNMYGEDLNKGANATINIDSCEQLPEELARALKAIL